MATTPKCALLLCAFFFLAIHAVVAHYEHPHTQIQVHRTEVAHPSISATASISVTPTTLTGTYGWVKTSYSVASPTIGDWVGLYLQNDDASQKAPIKHLMAVSDPNFLTTGSGTLNFHLVNMRDAVKFCFFTGSFSKPVLAGCTSEVVAFTDVNLPMGGHLIPGETYDEIDIMWTTRDTSTPEVRWGTEPGVYTFSNAATTTSYAVTDLCGGPAVTVGWREPGEIHRASMSDLTTGVEYYYVYGDSNLNSWSNESHFHLPPLAGDEKVSIVVFGDMGKADLDSTSFHWTQISSLQTVNAIYTTTITEESSNADFVAHIGDVAYAVGYASDWDYWMEQMAPLATRVVYTASPGNHEFDFNQFNNENAATFFNGTDSGGECGVPFTHRYPMPGTSYTNPWFSMSSGPVHMIYLSTEHDFNPGSPQYQWLEQDLIAANANRKNVPWILMTGHRPLYLSSTGIGDQIAAAQMKYALEPLAAKYNVDVWFGGHHHSQQATCRVLNEVCVPDDSTNGGTYYLLVGAAGFSLSQNIEDTPADFMTWVEDTYWGFGRIEATKTNLVVNIYNNIGPTQVYQLTLNKSAADQQLLSSSVVHNKMTSLS